MVSLNFNAASVEPLGTPNLLPDGKYVAMITRSEMRMNKAGTGSYLELEFSIIEGKYRGRRLWARLNINHPNEVAVQLARAELSAICRAVNVMYLQDSVELHNIPLVITVSQKHSNGFATNVIRGYDRYAPDNQQDTHWF